MKHTWKKDFAAKFSIPIIPEPRCFKYYNYFDFIDFFEFHQIYKASFALGVPRAYLHSYLSKPDIEIFTNFEKCKDLNGSYEYVFNYRVYFLVHENGHITSLKTENKLNML